MIAHQSRARVQTLEVVLGKKGRLDVDRLEVNRFYSMLTDSKLTDFPPTKKKQNKGGVESSPSSGDLKPWIRILRGSRSGLRLNSLR